VIHQDQFCEARISVLKQSPDRVAALGAALRVSGGVLDDELIGWAINQLQSLKSDRAYAELQRYANEIDALPEGSKLRRELWAKRLQIRQEPARTQQR
jgi:hypothetical protein